MKKLKALCGVTLLAASVGVNAEIKPIENTDLAKVDGQLGLIDSTRTLAALKAVQVIHTHESGDYAAQYNAVKAHARAQMADHVSDAKRNMSFLKAEIADSLGDINRIDTSISAHVADHAADVQRKAGILATIGADHISDEVADTKGVIGIIRAY